MKSNGLTLNKNKLSKIEKLELKQDIQKQIFQEFKTKAHIVAYFVNQVLAGTVENDKIHFFKEKKFNEKYLSMVRVFNTDKELFLRKTNNKFIGRLRTDNIGELCEYIDADQILLGTCSKVKNGYSILKENKFFLKGFIIPGEFHINEESEKRIAIKTRNYIGYTPCFQAEYIDSRFIEFCLVKPEKKGGK